MLGADAKTADIAIGAQAEAVGEIQVVASADQRIALLIKKYWRNKIHSTG